MSTSATIQILNVNSPFAVTVSHDGYPSFFLAALNRFYAAHGKSGTFDDFEREFRAGYENPCDNVTVTNEFNTNDVGWEYLVTNANWLFLTGYPFTATKKYYHPLDQLKTTTNDYKLSTAKEILDALETLESKHGIHLKFFDGKGNKA